MSAACSILDADITHCSQPFRGQGSPNVLVNGMPWSCQTHINIPHSKPVGNRCVVHVAPIAFGSTSVLINGLRAGRMGDPIAGFVGNIFEQCTAVAEGSANVFCGFF